MTFDIGRCDDVLPSHKYCVQDLLECTGVYPGCQVIGCEILYLTACGQHETWQFMRHSEGPLTLDLPFPVAGGYSRQVAMAYGIHQAQQDTAVERTAFVIDDKGILRARIHCSPGSGCSAGELLHQVRKLQAMDSLSGMTNGTEGSPWYF